MASWVLSYVRVIEALLDSLRHFPRHRRTTPKPDEFPGGLDLYGRRPNHLALAILHVQDAQAAAGQIDLIPDGQLSHD